ncbi:MAG: phosphoribosylamine--glycine ligase, partial [Bacillota bacterium]
MKVLVVGGGGREHALVWKLRQSPRVAQIFCAPGNAGIARQATCVQIKAEDIEGLLNFAVKEKIDLTIVGPEAPLTAGIGDAFTRAGLNIFGPSAAAAAIEGSKVWAKKFMSKYNIPTADYVVFDQPEKAKEYVLKRAGPLVVKADGLAAGKGVKVCGSPAEALAAITEIMEKKVFGRAGERVVIEECLKGEEASILAFTDGETVLPMLAAQDHKQVYDNDQGPNTGGMGAYAPVPVCTSRVYEEALEKILIPAVKGLAREGCPYRGVLYAGLMVTEQGLKVLEFNARFGDPEAQPLLVLFQTDLVEICEAVLTGRLAAQKICWADGAAVCVVLASGGYPGPYPKGKVISGLDRVPDDIMVFHAGTALVDGQVVTAGGRVLGVTAVAKTIREAIDRAYQGVQAINFE